MKAFRKYYFLSWDESGKTATALAKGEYVSQAIYLLRDGQMGEKGSDGVYERTWASDAIDNYPEKNLRYATEEEARFWMKHCSLRISLIEFTGQKHPEDYSSVIYSDTCSYVLVEEMEETED